MINYTTSFFKYKETKACIIQFWYLKGNLYLTAVKKETVIKPQKIFSIIYMLGIKYFFKIEKWSNAKKRLMVEERSGKYYGW